jgi:tRNA(adenine34) deaminase
MALDEARVAVAMGEVPVGAVLVVEGEAIAKAHNLKETVNDPTAHAEVLALREGARKLKRWRLTDCALYVTKEPCIMCSGAMVNARLGKLVYACRDPKGGAAESLYNIPTDPRLNHRVEVVSGVLEEECRELLKGFFEEKRIKINE